jgi:hypothetical protein
MYNTNYSNPNIRNSIVWGNNSVSTSTYNVASTPNITYSLIEGSGGSDGIWDAAYGVDGGGNIDKNPMFQDFKPAMTESTTDGDYRLRSYSPAIDTGNSVFAAGLIHTDLGGYPRIVGAQVDRGAYEYQGSATTIKELKASPAQVNMGLEANNIQQLLVKAILSDDTEDDVTSSTKGTSYTSGDITVATVTADGLIEAKKVGSTTITIANSGITTTVEVSVLSFNEPTLSTTSASFDKKLSAQADVTTTL